MISLGLDPSLTGFGWCIHDSDAVGQARVVAKGQYHTEAKDLFVTRYMYLRDSVDDLLRKHPEVHVVGIESSIFGEQWSPGGYGLFLYVNEAVYGLRKDVVFFDPSTVKLLAKGSRRPGKMFKSDMVETAKQDTDGAKVRWNHNEADAYVIAKGAARFWSFFEGYIEEESLNPAEHHVFAKTHTYRRGKRAGETTKTGTIFREGDRFYQFSKIPR